MKMIDSVIEMKNIENQMFGTSYKEFFLNLEDQIISKINGVEVVKQVLEKYDEIAKIYIIHQVNELAPNIIGEVVRAANVDPSQIPLPSQYAAELLSAEEFHSLSHFGL